MFRQAPAGSSGSSKWEAPTEGRLKANVDAGWAPLSKKVGLGIIIRDHLGQPLLNEWKFVPSCASAEEAEVLAYLEGLNHMIDFHRWSVMLESDYLLVV